MGMPKGSRWKRLAVFSDMVNIASAPVVARVLRAHRIEIEWWNRTVVSKSERGTAPQLGRDEHPLAEEWLMVRRGDWPLAYVLAKDIGVNMEKEASSTT